MKSNKSVLGSEPCPLLSSPENDRPSSLVSEVIDYNMPLTTTYMKQMKLQCMNNNKVRETAAAQLLYLI